MYIYLEKNKLYCSLKLQTLNSQLNKKNFRTITENYEICFIHEICFLKFFYDFFLTELRDFKNLLSVLYITFMYHAHRKTWRNDYCGSSNETDQFAVKIAGNEFSSQSTIDCLSQSVNSTGTIDRRASCVTQLKQLVNCCQLMHPLWVCILAVELWNGGSLLG